jgi:Fur family peroxide stress response transcriptional regulator
MSMVQELGFADENSRHDPNVTPHINVICRRCGDIYDYETRAIRNLWSQNIGELGFKPIGQRLDLYRYCDKCNEK